jgi:syntaxin 16
VANVIADQGTILDRIDFNIEQTDVRVKSAAKSVLKAEQYQRKHSKILCIIILACAIIFFLFLLLMKL